MSIALFEMGAQSPEGQDFDVEVAAAFYLPIRDRAASLGLDDLSARLTRMAEIDAEIAQQAMAESSAPIFLTPDAYPIEGEAPQILYLISQLRRLLTHPDKKMLVLGPVQNEVGDENDLAVSRQVEELEQLLVHPDYQPMGYIEPDERTLHWYMPTVINGVVIQKEEVEMNINKGAYTLENDRRIDLPPKYMRRLELTVYRSAPSEK